jgi:hypothetical protein
VTLASRPTYRRSKGVNNRYPQISRKNGWSRRYLFQPFVFWLTIFARLLAGSAMAATLTRTAISRFGKFAVRPNAGLRHGAPKEAVARAGDGGIRRGPYVLALPMQRGAQPRTFRVESLWYVAHAAPPAACDPAAARMARFTATWARWILCALCPRLFALATAA